MKKILAIILTAAVLCAMTGCSFSSSSSSFSFSTSVTDEEGHTETNTVSGEVGVSAGTDGVTVTADATSTAD